MRGTFWASLAAMGLAGAGTLAITAAADPADAIAHVGSRVAMGADGHPLLLVTLRNTTDRSFARADLRVAFLDAAGGQLAVKVVTTRRLAAGGIWTFSVPLPVPAAVVARYRLEHLTCGPRSGVRTRACGLAHEAAIGGRDAAAVAWGRC